MRKDVGQAPTAGEQTQQNPRRTSSDIGAEQENYKSRTRFDVGSERVKRNIKIYIKNAPTCFGLITIIRVHAI
jgi:hypothetical protein